MNVDSDSFEQQLSNHDAGIAVLDIDGRRGIVLAGSSSQWKDIQWEDGEREDNVPAWRLREEL